LQHAALIVNRRVIADDWRWSRKAGNKGNNCQQEWQNELKAGLWQTLPQAGVGLQVRTARVQSGFIH
jgi:hypothetical protein